MDQHVYDHILELSLTLTSTVGIGTPESYSLTMGQWGEEPSPCYIYHEYNISHVIFTPLALM